jgi:hypothetical protein
MIVEPVSTVPRSRRRRVLSGVGLAMPVALLVAVAAFGIAGEGPEGDRAVPTPLGIAPPPTTPAPAVDDRRAPFDAETVTSYPETLDTLQVRTVREILAVPPAPGEIVAISGVLAFETMVGQCKAASPRLATFCSRATILADRPVVVSSSPGNLGPHLHPLVPAGVRLPRAILPDPRTGDRAQVPVIVLATAGADGVRLERVAWVGGSRWQATTIDPDLGRNPFDETWWRRRLAAEEGLGMTARNGTPVMLLTAYVRPATLETLHRAAAVAVRAAAPDARALWFVRALYPGGVGEGTPRRDEVRWIVVDDQSGAIVARGIGEPG